MVETQQNFLGPYYRNVALEFQVSDVRIYEFRILMFFFLFVGCSSVVLLCWYIIIVGRNYNGRLIYIKATVIPLNALAVTNSCVATVGGHMWRGIPLQPHSR